MRNFETFTGRSAPASRNIPRLGIQTRGTMSLNKAAYEVLGSPAAVFLMYDKDTKAIGVKGAKVEERHAYPIRKQQGSESYMIGAVSFCKHYEIDVSHTTAFTPKLEDGVLVCELDKGQAIGKRSRRPKVTTPSPPAEGGE